MAWEIQRRGRRETANRWALRCVPRALATVPLAERKEELMDGSVRLRLAARMGEVPIAPGRAAASVAPDGLGEEADAREKSWSLAGPARPDRTRVQPARLASRLPASLASHLPACFQPAVGEPGAPRGLPGDPASFLRLPWRPAAGSRDRWAPLAPAARSPPSRPVVRDRAWPRHRCLGRRPAGSLGPVPEFHPGLHDRISAAI